MTSVNVSFTSEEITTMRSECYRHWIARWGRSLEDMAWDMLTVDDFPNGGWSQAGDEDIVEYWVKKVKPENPAGVG